MLVALAAKWLDRPGFNAIIFRRETPQLDNLLKKAREIYKFGRPGKSAPSIPIARENLNDHRWRVDGGGQVRFWHCQREDDARAHDGDEFQYIGFDELTHFLESQFDNLVMRLRGSTAGLPRIVRATTNPGGPGAEWVKRRWGPWLDKKFRCDDWEEHWTDAYGAERVTRGKGLPPRFDARGNPLPPAEGGQVLYVSMFGSTERFSTEPFDAMGAAALSRTFVPAKLSDNPALLKEDPGYLARIRAGKDPVRRKQLEEGDWDVAYGAGEVFKRAWFEIVDAVPPGRAVRCRAWDLAGTEPSTGNADPDWTRGVKLAKHEDGFYYVEHLVGRRAHPGVVEQLVKSTANEDGKTTRVRIPIDPAQAGKAQASNFVRLLEGFDVHTVSTSGRGDKLTRAGIVAAQVSPQSTGGTFGRFRIVRGSWNAEFLDELEAFPDGPHDDIADAFSDAHDELTDTMLAPPPPPEPLPQTDWRSAGRGYGPG
jgi:predicted phage terminase large subunit-like protein